jgi:hypothetical protein
MYSILISGLICTKSGSRESGRNIALSSIVAFELLVGGTRKKRLIRIFRFLNLSEPIMKVISAIPTTYKTWINDKKEEQRSSSRTDPRSSDLVKRIGLPS